MKLYKITNKELRKSKPNDFGVKAMLDIHDAKSGNWIYIIHLIKSKKYKDSKYPYGWESIVEDPDTYKILDCTPGVEIPYYINEFLHRN